MKFVLIGKSGIGKTRQGRILSETLSIPRVISTTTRCPRPGEEEGRDYYYVSLQEFEQRSRDKRLVAETTFKGERYGMGREHIPDDCVIIVEPSGLSALREVFDDVVSVYLFASEGERKRRLNLRGSRCEEKDEERFDIFYDADKTDRDFVIDASGSVSDVASDLLHLYNWAKHNITEFERSKPVGATRRHIRLVSWNVAGLRARIKSDFEDTCLKMNPDIICLQETKVTSGELPAVLPEYHCYLNPAQRKGYSGTAIYTKEKPINTVFGFPSLGNSEGRLIAAEYEDFILVNVYTPNAKRDLSRLSERLAWDREFMRICSSIAKHRPVIIAGDLNCSHRPIDIHNPANKQRMAGYTDAERKAFSRLLASGFVDTFRHINGDVKGQYTFWNHYGNCREKNVGWRLDYFLVSNNLINKVYDAGIERFAGDSDHCPITLSLRL